MKLCTCFHFDRDHTNSGCWGTFRDEDGFEWNCECLEFELDED